MAVNGGVSLAVWDHTVLPCTQLGCKVTLRVTRHNLNTPRQYGKLQRSTLEFANREEETVDD